MKDIKLRELFRYPKWYTLPGWAKNLIDNTFATIAIAGIILLVVGGIGMIVFKIGAAIGKAEKSKYENVVDKGVIEYIEAKWPETKED